MRYKYHLISILTVIAGAASAASTPPGIALVGTTGPITFTISSDGHMVTLQNQDLQRSIFVDVVQSCGARAIGDPNKRDLVEITNTELRITYATRCMVRIMRDASSSSCSGCT